MKFPEHKCSLTLQHNDHRDLYQHLRDWIDIHDGYVWESVEAKERAIATDECWTLHWYPETPVGFHCVAAPTLEECLAFALRQEGR